MSTFILHSDGSCRPRASGCCWGDGPQGLPPSLASGAHALGLPFTQQAECGKVMRKLIAAYAVAHALVLVAAVYWPGGAQSLNNRANDGQWGGAFGTGRDRFEPATPAGWRQPAGAVRQPTLGGGDRFGGAAAGFGPSHSNPGRGV
jgi:hypothetical protein